MRRVRRVVEMARDREREEERAQFLLNKEVSRTKQLMSLRLGGPARGFVLITSRREGERGEVRWRRGEDSASLLLSHLCRSFFFLRSTYLRFSFLSRFLFSLFIEEQR